jgi:hypothetical protein
VEFVIAMAPERRAAVRQSSAIEATVEDPRFPISSVLVDDISTVGFRMAAAVEVVVGEHVAVNLPRVGLRAARVVRQVGFRYACSFVSPISAGDLRLITAAGAEKAALQRHRHSIGWRPGYEEMAA